MPKKVQLTLGQKIIRDYGYGKVINPDMLRRKYGRSYSESYLKAFLSRHEKTRKASSALRVFFWRVSEGRYKVIRPYKRRDRW